MITGDYDQLNDLVGNHACAVCQGHLVVAWHKDKSCYYIKCGACDECKAITKVMSLTEAHKAGEELPEPVKSNVKKAIEKRAQRLPKEPAAETFSGVPAADLGTGELVPVDKLQALVAYARRYGLDPARGHVALMYGEPYFTIDAYLYHAKQEKIPYSLFAWPLTDKERDQYQIDTGDHAWMSKVVLIDSGASFEGIGIVTKAEMDEMSKRYPDRYANPVVREKPWYQAKKRAEWQALRRAFPIGDSEEGRD